MTASVNSKTKLAILAIPFLAIGAAKLTRSLGDEFQSGTPWIFYGALVLTGVIGAATVMSALFPGRRNPLVPFIITLLAGSIAWLSRPGGAFLA